VQLGYGLCDKRVGGLRLRCLREFLEDVECGLVLVAALRLLVVMLGNA
jgi:hypothetical protein